MWNVEVDSADVDFIRGRHSELGSGFPRFALFLFQWRCAEALGRTLERIPAETVGWLDEVVVMMDAASAPTDADQKALRAAGEKRGLRLQFHRQPRNHDFGGARKAAFEYAIQRGFDFAIAMRGDGLHPAEALPALIRTSLDSPQSFALAARVHRLKARPAGLPLARMLAHLASTGLQNRLLALQLDDYHSSFRVYPTEVLRRIPFHLNSNDRAFDMQMLIQCRALGFPIEEVRVPPVWEEYPDGWKGGREVLAACANAVDYRLHQLHVSRKGRYFVDRSVHYTLKQSPTSSHMQIVDGIAAGSAVLDLGCSQGLLARPLAEKGVRVVGVDVGSPNGLASHLAAYHRRDLEGPLDLPLGREFDYIVISDVIEHLRNRAQLLRGARRFLKEGGRLIISTPNVALWFYRLSLLLGRFEYGSRGVLDATHVHLFTRASFRREVEKAGFHVLQERVTALPFEVVFESTGRSRTMQRVAASYHALARLWPELFAYQVILEAEITTLGEESTLQTPAG